MANIPLSKQSSSNLFPVTLLLVIGLCYLAAGLFIAINPNNYVVLSEGSPLNLLVFASGPIFITVALWLSQAKKWLKILITIVSTGLTAITFFITAIIYYMSIDDEPAHSVAISPDNAWELFVSPGGSSFKAGGGGSAYLQFRDGIFSQRVNLSCSRIDGSVAIESAQFIDNRIVELILSDESKWPISFDPTTAMSYSQHDYCATKVGHAK